MNDFFSLHSEHLEEINASTRAILHVRLVLSNINKNPTNQFPSSVKKERRFDVPDGAIAYLTKEYGENIHDCHFVAVPCRSFEKENHGPNLNSGAYDSNVRNVAKMLLIWELIPISFQHIAWRKILHTKAMIGYVTISMRGGRCLCTTGPACGMVVPTIFIENHARFFEQWHCEWPEN
jgi:hypothetical protein